MKNTRKSRSRKVLTVGDGGLSALKRPPQPLQSLARGESPKQSLALAQQEQPPTSTLVGGGLSSSGKKYVLTGDGASLIPNSTLAGTLNWARSLLQKRGLIWFGVNNETGEIEIHLPVSTWEMAGDVLTLKSVEETRHRFDTENEG